MPPGSEEAVARAAAHLDARDLDAFRARLEVHAAAIHERAARLYDDARVVTRRLLAATADAAVARDPQLRSLDHRREIRPDWFADARMVGYVCYVDRFAGTLRAVEERLDHLGDLGVTYLHLMPLLRPREGDNDGGYAVADYDAVDPRLGTMADLEGLAAILRGRGISLCVDVVINHTAREHEWAQRARAGEQRYVDYYLTFPDRHGPDAYEATLPEVFPTTAPGNFTFEPELDRWVWTTFHHWQWDLGWANPDVLLEMVGVILRLANRGVDVLRLDAVPFLWKRFGTDCQNQPETHLLVQLLRRVTAIAAPGVLLKGEAIVPPSELVGYLGSSPDGSETDECHLAYHNQLMVQGWSSLAARDARVATHALRRMPDPPAGTTWVTYVRIHDDIGWAVDDADAPAAAWQGATHRRFLADFYAGEVPGSFAAGERFQVNPLTGDARTSGGTAALCGITTTRVEGGPALDDAVQRLLLLYGLAAAYGGIPLVYMGDEIALDDDRAYLEDAALARDNRWRHRPFMDWDAAARRHVPGTVEQRVYDGLVALLRARARVPAFHAAAPARPRWHDNPHVLAFLRTHPRHGEALVLVNFDERHQAVTAADLDVGWLASARDVLADGHPVELVGGRLRLPGLGMSWLVPRARTRARPRT